MASLFGITRPVLLLLQGWFVRPMFASTSFAGGKTMTYPGFEPRTSGFQVVNDNDKIINLRIFVGINYSNVQLIP
jgi:hypothetical protein